MLEPIVTQTIADNYLQFIHHATCMRYADASSVLSILAYPFL